MAAHALLQPRALLHHPRDTLKDLIFAGHVITITYHQGRSMLPFSPVCYGQSSYQQSWGPNSPYSPYSSAYPSSLSPQVPDSPFILKFLNHMLKVCAGCWGGYFKNADGSLPDPPYDICVSHERVITLSPRHLSRSLPSRITMHNHRVSSLRILRSIPHLL